MEARGSNTLVIFNPASDGGRGAKRIPRYIELLGLHLPDHDHVVTSRGGEEASLTDQALQDGYGSIVGVGGDGTLSTIADRILAHEDGDVLFGALPSGTGNDFGRNVGILGNDLDAAVQTLVQGRTRVIDSGCILTECSHEERGDSIRAGRFFLNLVGFGFDVSVVDVAKRARFLRGEVLYKTAALQQLFRFPGFQVTLTDDADYETPSQTLMLTISNGPHFGGGFPISPRASTDDGMLHSCLIKDTKPLRRLFLFDKAGKGRHEDAPEVEAHSAPSFRVTSTPPLRFEVDGDIFVAPKGEVRVEVRKKALKVIVPRNG